MTQEGWPTSRSLNILVNLQCPFTINFTFLWPVVKYNPNSKSPSYPVTSRLPNNISCSYVFRKSKHFETHTHICPCVLVFRILTLNGCPVTSFGPNAGPGLTISATENLRYSDGTLPLEVQGFISSLSARSPLPKVNFIIIIMIFTAFAFCYSLRVDVTQNHHHALYSLCILLQPEGGCDSTESQ